MMMAETPNIRLKRLTMRSCRRGMKEMDLILGGFARRGLADLTEPDLRDYERLLSENDQEIYRWVTGQTPVPAQYDGLLKQILATTR